MPYPQHYVAWQALMFYKVRPRVDVGWLRMDRHWFNISNCISVALLLILRCIVAVVKVMVWVHGQAIVPASGQPTSPLSSHRQLGI